MNEIVTKQESLTVLYGSRSGNAKAVAELTASYSLYSGIKTELWDMHNMDYERFKEVTNLIVVVSTHGEGEPPYTAEDFYDWIHSEKAPSMADVSYMVIGLGDSSYKHFCKTAIDIDHRLNELSASRMREVQSCDLDFGPTAIEWIENSIPVWTSRLPQNIDPNRGAFQFILNTDLVGELKGFPAKVVEKKLLNPGSGHEVLHLSLNIKNSNLEYNPGDAIGIYSTNSRWLVDRFIKRLNLDRSQAIEVSGKSKLLKVALIEDFELTVVTAKVMRDYAKETGNERITELLNDKEFVQEYTANRDVLDMVVDFPENITAEQLPKFMRKLPPRFYSVASSQKTDKDIVDITIRVIEFERQERSYFGVCSHMLSNRIDEAEYLQIFVDKNPSFHLPENKDADIILVGAGSGIAPFRAFLNERNSVNSKGKSWLIFGERNADTDFLYGDEMMEFQKKGVLSKIDTAFSRDHEEKYYVGHVILENGPSVIEWINNGAYFYICGNKRTIGASVKDALVTVFMKEMSINREEAISYYADLKKSKRIREDVY